MFEAAEKQLLGERFFDVLLNDAGQRTGAELLVGPVLDQELLGGLVELEREAAFGQPLGMTEARLSTLQTRSCPGLRVVLAPRISQPSSRRRKATSSS